MDNLDRLLAAIDKLLSAFPPVNSAGSADDVLRRYIEAVDGFGIELVEGGVSLVLKGELPGHDGRFAPTPPMLATACRIQADRVARQHYLDGITAPRLPAPEIVKTPEQRERAKAKVAEFIKSVAAADLHQDTEASKRARERWEKVNARFQPAMDDASIMERLLGYSAGSPESDEAAA